MPNLCAQASIMTAACNGQPILLFLDWDSTLTAESTLPLIASVATYPEQHPHLLELSNAYINDLNAHNANYRPLPSDRKTLDQELEYLESLSVVEKASISRVEASGIFKDVTPAGIELATESFVKNGKIKLRKGWKQLIRSVQQPMEGTVRGEVHVVSVAWSALFISSCLQKFLGPDNPCGHDITIHANEVHPSGSGKLLGPTLDCGSRILTARNKLRVLRNIISDYRAAHPLLEPKTCYLGDSPTDLACLMDADVGVCVHDQVISEEQKQLYETLLRLGAHVTPIDEYDSTTQEGGIGYRNDPSAKQVLWSARDFSEVFQSGILT